MILIPSRLSNDYVRAGLARAAAMQATSLAAGRAPPLLRLPPPPPRLDPALLCERALRDYLGGLSRTRLREAVRLHELPPPRPIGGKPLWSRADVDRAIARKWGLSDGPDTSDVERRRSKAMEAARAFRPPAPRLGRAR